MIISKWKKSERASYRFVIISSRNIKNLYDEKLNIGCEIFHSSFYEFLFIKLPSFIVISLYLDSYIFWLNLMEIVMDLITWYDIIEMKKKLTHSP